MITNMLIWLEYTGWSKKLCQLDVLSLPIGLDFWRSYSDISQVALSVCTKYSTRDTASSTVVDNFTLRHTLNIQH